MAAESVGSATVGSGFFLGRPLPRRGGGVVKADAAKSASEKFIICCEHRCEQKMLAVLAEQTTAAEREGVGKFAMVGGLAEWKRTIALTRGAEQLVRKVRNFSAFALLSANVDGAAAAAHRHPRSHQNPVSPGLNPAKKFFQTFPLCRFQGIQRTSQGVMGQNMALNGWHE